MNYEKKSSKDLIDKACMKIKTAQKISDLAKGRNIYTKGVFDIFHAGHMSLFAFISELKKELNLSVIVSVTSDVVVKAKKGLDRPINRQDVRLQLISLIDCVDYVHLNNSYDMVDNIKLFSPNVYIKGMDTFASTNEKNIKTMSPELSLLDPQGALIIFCDDSSISTSDIIKTIQQRG